MDRIVLSLTLSVIINLIITIWPLIVSAQPPRPTSSPPNIVLILADDLGYGDVAPFNPEINHAPNIAALAEGGVVASSFYVPVSVCTPSRAALMTGLYPARLDEPLQWVLLRTRPQGGLHLGDSGLAGRLRSAGYHTGTVGKWHLNNDGGTPLDNGFDYAYWLPYGNATDTLEVWRDRRRIEVYPDYSAMNNRFITESKAFVDAAGDEPFFLYAPHIWPHTPLLLNQKPGLDYYQSAVAEVDDFVGAITDHLAARQLLDNTIIIFMSDNGPDHTPHLVDGVCISLVFVPLAEQGVYPDADNPARWQTGSLGPFRQPIVDERGVAVFRTGKETPYEGGTRVPFVAYWPAGLRPRTTDEPMISMDLYPTLLRIAGADIGPTDGVDVLDVWRGAAGPTRVFHYHWGNRDHLYGAIRAGRWKLHVTDGQPKALYDIVADPAESVNLIDKKPGIVADLMSQVAHFGRVYVPVIR